MHARVKGGIDTGCEQNKKNQPMPNPSSMIKARDPVCYVPSLGHDLAGVTGDDIVLCGVALLKTGQNPGQWEMLVLENACEPPTAKEKHVLMVQRNSDLSFSPS